MGRAARQRGGHEPGAGGGLVVGRRRGAPSRGPAGLDGARCDTGPGDLGVHTVCARVTAEFLAFSASVGNDLSTPQPEYGFKGLKPGDRWCVCAARWQEAMDAGYAPPVILESTHEAALDVIEFADLEKHELRRVEQE